MSYRCDPYCVIHIYCNAMNGLICTHMIPYFFTFWIQVGAESTHTTRYYQILQATPPDQKYPRGHPTVSRTHALHCVKVTIKIHWRPWSQHEWCHFCQQQCAPQTAVWFVCDPHNARLYSTLFNVNLLLLPLVDKQSLLNKLNLNSFLFICSVILVIACNVFILIPFYCLFVFWHVCKLNLDWKLSSVFNKTGD